MRERESRDFFKNFQKFSTYLDVGVGMLDKMGSSLIILPKSFFLIGGGGIGACLSGGTASSPKMSITFSSFEVILSLSLSIYLSPDLEVDDVDDIRITLLI